MVSIDGATHPDRESRQAAAYQYQQDCRYFAQIADGLKEAGAKEITELGAKNVQSEFSGIYFKADKSTLYRINYLSRLLSRCLAPLASYACPDTDTLYQKAKQIRWEDFFTEGKTFAVSGNVSDSAISHSKYAALRLKDAIADYFKEKTGQRPDVSVRNPDIPLNLHIRNDKAVISLDTSGGALHRRGDSVNGTALFLFMTHCVAREPFCVKHSCNIATFLRAYSDSDSVLNLCPTSTALSGGR
jgi:putative N6-adenine-specific DNA methylase